MTINVSYLAVILIGFATAHLVNYGRWSWSKGNKRGAIGLYIYAVITSVFPLVMLIKANL